MNIYPTRSVRTEDWKYIRNLHPEYYYSTHVDLVQANDGGGYFGSWVDRAKTDPLAAAILKRYHERPAEELYDLRGDPNELKNLATDPAHARRLAQLRADVDSWMKEQGDAGRLYGEPRLLTDPSGQIRRRRRRRKSNDGGADAAAEPVRHPPWYWR